MSRINPWSVEEILNYDYLKIFKNMIFYRLFFCWINFFACALFVSLMRGDKFCKHCFPNVNSHDVYTVFICGSLQKPICADNTFYCKTSHIILGKSLTSPDIRFSLICSYWKGTFCLRTLESFRGGLSKPYQASVSLYLHLG